MTSEIRVEGLPRYDGANLRWLTITPWIGARFRVHVPVPGGISLGRTYDRGADNRVATLTGLVTWNGEGESFLNNLGGKIVTVYNGATHTSDDDWGTGVEAITDAPVVIEAVTKAVIKFTVTLTETEYRGDA